MFNRYKNRRKLVFLLLTLNTLLSANGTMTDPISRIYQCREEGPYSLTSSACKAAANYSKDIKTLFDWSNISHDNVNSNHRSVIEDGALCSASNERYRGFDLARSDWKATSVVANEEYTFKFFESQPHTTKYFKYYITKDSYTPTKALTWNDLELVCEEGSQKEEAFHSTTCVMPDRIGKHILYTVWQHADSKKALYSCSDIDFSASGTTLDRVEVYKMNKSYTKGMKVDYNSTIYQAQWRSKNEIPGKSKWNSWKKIDKENKKPNLELFVPYNKQIFYQNRLSKILIEFEADDSDGTVDVVMAKINGKYYAMRKFGSIFYRLEYLPKVFGTHTIEIQITDNKLETTFKTVEIEVLEK